VLKEGRDPQEYNDTVVDVEIIDEVSTGSNHRLFMRTASPSATDEPYVFEVDVPAHPYEVLGIASRRDWRIVLSSRWMALVPGAAEGEGRGN
jgi:hypothetical protein